MIRHPALRELIAFSSGVLITVGSCILGARVYYGVTYLDEWRALRDVAYCIRTDCTAERTTYYVK